MTTRRVADNGARGGKITFVAILGSIATNLVAIMPRMATKSAKTSNCVATMNTPRALIISTNFVAVIGHYTDVQIMPLNINFKDSNSSSIKK